MQEGDLIVIGPQRHGVPTMPEISEGSLRISVPFTPQKRDSKHVHQAPSAQTKDAEEEDDERWYPVHGEEVDTFGTNPLLADSDGHGL